jgi:hypothetical protein
MFFKYQRRGEEIYLAFENIDNRFHNSLGVPMDEDVEQLTQRGAAL